MNGRLNLFGCMSLAGGLLLSGCGSDDQSASGALAELAVQSPRPLAIVTPHGSAQVESLWGVLGGRTSSATAADARAFILENARGLRVAGAEALVHERSSESPMGSHHVFRQVIGGVPVDGADVRVHFDRRGQVVGATTSAIADLGPIDVRPTIDASTAIRHAEATLSPAERAATSPLREEPRLLIHAADPAAPRLCWEIIAPTDDGPTWRALVDAHSGRLVERPRDINRYVNGTGKVWIGANAIVATHNNALRDNNNAASAVPASAYQTVTLQGLAGTGFLDGAYASSSATKKRSSNAGNNFLYDRSVTGFEETLAYYSIDLTERYIQSLGFTNINNRQQIFSANGSTVDNSSYSPSTKKISYGTGGVDDAEDAEVVIHEYGHSIQDNQVPGFGSGREAGAQGEGFGDYLAASIGAQTSGGFQDTCVMEWDATSYSTSNPPCLRRTDSPKHYPENIANEVHADGELWSSALWTIRAQLGGPRADKVILQHHFLLPPSASFNTASSALVTAANNLAYSATECAAIKTALQNRGFTVTASCL